LHESPIIQKALEKYYNSDIPNRIPQFLPIVEKFCEEKLTQDSFANMDVLFIQHHLGPLIPRIRAMIGCGLDISRCWFIDIPYSTNIRVREELRRMGCPDNQMVRIFNDPIDPYSRRQLERAEYLIKQLAYQNNSKILVIDDGAYFTRTLNRLMYRDKDLILRFKERKTCIVEQTTRGLRYLNKKGKKILKYLNIPAVSIARTNTKYTLESPFIGASVSLGIINKLKETGRLSNDLGRILIIGFGAVGKATTQALLDYKHTKSIDVYDINENLHGEIESIGNPGDTQAFSTLPQKGPYNTIFGCTGYASITSEKELNILAQNGVLISGSSAAIEFNREKFIDRAYKSDKDGFFIIDAEKARINGIHSSINMQLKNKQFSFLNAGFPANFDGQLECVPYQIIQLTHGLLIAAAQESLFQSPGLHPLNSHDDEWFYDQGIEVFKNYSQG